MSDLPKFDSSSLAGAIEYPIGLRFEVVFGTFAVILTTLSGGEIHFRIDEGPYARSETVKIVATPIRPGVFLVSWIEASGATVVHVEDFARGIVYSHATLASGTFLRMNGPIRIVSRGVAH